jgi:phage baseplate assembly protein W
MAGIIKAGTYKDLDLDFFKNSATNDVTVKKDDEAIKRSVRNLVLTNFYERKFHPEIGSGVYGLLFENMTPLVDRRIERAITEIISIYEPRVSGVSVESNPKYDENAYEVSIRFTIRAANTLAQITLFLERLR